MSTFNCYLGYIKDGKIYPFGPFNSKGELKPVITKTYDIFRRFNREIKEVTDEEFSDELYGKFECDGDKRKNKRFHVPLNKLMYKDLPAGDFVKKGFFLMDEVNEYENNENNDHYLYHFKTPAVYAEMLKNKVQLSNVKEYDYEGNPISSTLRTEYMYYAYPDYSSKFFDCFIITKLIDALRKDEELMEKDIVILQTEDKKEDNKYEFNI